MKQLLELEQKVLDIIQRNKKLYALNNELKAENAQLRNQAGQLERSLLQENDKQQSLDSEKMAIKSAIEELLEGIDSIEKTE